MKQKSYFKVQMQNWCALSPEVIWHIEHHLGYFYLISEQKCAPCCEVMINELP